MPEESKEIARIEPQNKLMSAFDFEINAEAIERARRSYEMLEKFTNSVLEKGKDYGEIPGTNKPSLLQSGAISLKLAYQFTMKKHTDPPVIHLDWGYPFIAYTTHVEVWRGDILIDTHDGTCNSYEEKYRYRWLSEYKMNDAQKAIKDTVPKKTIKPKGKKPYTLYRFENEDPFALMNTYMQIAEKRAMVGVVRHTIPGAAKKFAQDIEDMVHDDEHEDDIEQSPSDPATMPIQADTGDMILQFAKEREVDPEVIKTHLKARYEKDRLAKLTEKEGLDFHAFLMKTFSRNTNDMGDTPSQVSGELSADTPQDDTEGVLADSPSVPPDAAELIAKVEKLLNKSPASNIEFARWFKKGFPSCKSIKDLSIDGAQACLDWFEEQIKEHDA